ncbi:MAG: hypothetical protein GDA35_09560 [Hyphomonadaceae bacterium]|nr:hypothetical protein [Hyphomonadaceae bacterium]
MTEDEQRLADDKMKADIYKCIAEANNFQMNAIKTYSDKQFTDIKARWFPYIGFTTLGMTLGALLIKVFGI